MAVFNSNDDFDDLQNQLRYVRTSLGYKVTPDELEPGCCRRGDGWSSPFYSIYCSRCAMEIEKPWIDPDDEEKSERCPECKKDDDLCSKQERKQEIRQRIDDLNKEEATMIKQRKKWKEFRAQYPLQEPDKLSYDENKQWTSTGIDLEAYVIDKWYIPSKICGLKEKAASLLAAHTMIEKQREKAITEKDLGNECYKKGNFKGAIKHYTASIGHRSDYKASYINRALMYFKLGEYDECIVDCSMVIDMITLVNADTMLSSNEMFKAYLRRGNALKSQSKYNAAKYDLDCALDIKPNEGASNKLLREIQIELKRNKLRTKLSHFDWDDESVSDFDSVLEVSTQFLCESAKAEAGFKLEGRDSDELFRRLFVFMCRNKKYTVRFVKNDGIEYCLKYLHCKLKILVDMKEHTLALDVEEKLRLLLRPYSILTMCCEQCVNLEELRRKKHGKYIRMVVLFTMRFFSEMDKDVKVQSMRFVSIAMSVESVRDNISEKSGAKMMQYFVQFQKKTDPKRQNTNSIRCLFETFSELFQTPKFRTNLYCQRAPYLYCILLHSFAVYNEWIKQIEAKNAKMYNDDFDNMEFAISVILDGLGLLFDAESCLGRSGYDDDDKKLQQETQEMVKHFAHNKNIEKYMMLLTGYLKASYLRYKEGDDDEKEHLRYFSQIVRSLNVLVQLSHPIYCEFMHKKLYEFNIDKEVSLLMLIIGRDPEMNERVSHKMRSMLKLAKYKILTYLDQVSDNAEFDASFGCLPFDANGTNKSVDILPYFWKFMMDVFVEQYKEKQYTPKLLEEFSMNKSRCIRTLYRWILRRNDGGEKSFILELILKKYFVQMCQWISYKDEQIMANAPLVITECLKYSMKHKFVKKKVIKKALSIKRLKDIMKLMIEKHHVIQYNSMLLMANCIDYDWQIAKNATRIGAKNILECYKNQKDKHKAILPK